MISKVTRGEIAAGFDEVLVKIEESGEIDVRTGDLLSAFLYEVKVVTDGLTAIRISVTDSALGGARGKAGLESGQFIHEVFNIVAAIATCSGHEGESENETEGESEIHFGLGLINNHYLVLDRIWVPRKKRIKNNNRASNSNKRGNVGSFL